MVKKQQKKPKSKAKTQDQAKPEITDEEIDDSETEQKVTVEQESNGDTDDVTEPETKQESQPEDSLPVWYEEQRTELLVDTVMSAVDFDLKKSHPKHPDSFALITKKSPHQVYYVSSDDFAKYVIAKHGIPENLGTLNQQTEDSLHELKRAWVKFGTNVLAVNTYRTYLQEYKTFEEYCEQKLKLHKVTVYEIMRSTMFLMRHEPELYDELMAGNVQEIPSYRSFYILDKKQKPLEKKGEFTKLLNMVLKGKLSTRSLQQKVKEILFPDALDVNSLPAAIKTYEKVHKKLKEMLGEGHQEIIEKFDELLEELKELDQ